MFKLAKYVWYDILRSKVIIAYTLLLLLVSISLFQLEADSSKALLSLLNIILLIVPLVGIIFATIHYYNSYEFIELMLSQPVSRTRILLSEYIGTAISLVAAFGIGVGVPVLIYQPTVTGCSLLFAGVMLTVITTSLAFLVSVRAKEKARGIGAALLCWFYFALLYDGLLLLLIFSFSDYPLEKVTLLLTSLNPIDLARIFLMLQLDISALMGYTGATYKLFFGSAWGLLYTAVIMLAWAGLPLWAAVRRFRRKDL